VTVGLSATLITGCATIVPYTGQGPHPQIERGTPITLVDGIGNLLALPFKLLFLTWKFDSHYISPDTEAAVIEYLAARDLPALHDTKYRLNQYRPGQDLSRLIHNRHVAWPYRLLFGLPTTLIYDVLLPGRVIPWGDYYNPFTNTVHLYSDHPAIALHESGHAHDFARHRFKGTYAIARLLPGVDLYQEWQASGEALRYLQDTNQRPAEVNAYKILYPAYGSYVGGYFFPPIGTLVGVGIGHAAGRSKAAMKAAYYQKLGPVKVYPEAATPAQPINQELAPATEEVVP
jgi:hypothetical protein